VVFFLITGLSEYANAQNSTHIDSLLYNAQELFDQASENEEQITQEIFHRQKV
jgi:hypothetical protein